ncbi:MAG: 30S ribosomal protein S12 methylthiotransferase RimO [Nitrospirota bacterium]
MKFYLISLGCAKNLVDSENIVHHLQKTGYSITGDISEASLIMINTCGFIEEAKKESIDTIFSVLKEKNRDAKVLVYGCLVKRYQKELERHVPEVDLFVPLLPHHQLTEKIKENFAPCEETGAPAAKPILFTPPSYRYIKISDGCNNFCSYCTIPAIRGDLRSYPVEDVLRRIKDVLDEGYSEINLVAQDITVYGKDLYGKPSLEFLLKKILSLRNDFWLRLLYVHPLRVSKELVEIIRSDARIVKYLDIPVQHVNTRILRLMNRHYSKDLLVRKITLLREKIPSIALRTSLIVGFPTEEESDFQELFDFVEKIRFDHVGVFEYSHEEGTPAFALKPTVPRSVRKRRRKSIMELQRKIARARNHAMKGKVFPCLIELPLDECRSIWIGRIYSQAPEVDGIVYVKGYGGNGNLTSVRVTGFKDYDLVAECVR